MSFSVCGYCGEQTLYNGFNYHGVVCADCNVRMHEWREEGVIRSMCHNCKVVVMSYNQTVLPPVFCLECQKKYPSNSYWKANPDHYLDWRTCILWNRNHARGGHFDEEAFDAHQERWAEWLKRYQKQFGKCHPNCTNCSLHSTYIQQNKEGSFAGAKRTARGGPGASSVGGTPGSPRKKQYIWTRKRE